MVFKYIVRRNLENAIDLLTSEEKDLEFYHRHFLKDFKMQFELVKFIQLIIAQMLRVKSLVLLMH